MKEKRNLKTLKTLCMVFVLLWVCASCDKEKSGDKDIATEESTSITTIDLSQYFEESEGILQQFWAACDKAYQAQEDAFILACTNHDWDEFLEIIGMTKEQMVRFRSTVIAEREALEHDHPGICDQFRESPCHDCQHNALSKIGNIEEQYKGTYTEYASKSSPKMCIFVCSMACMTTLEFYIPCLAACSATCIKY